MKTLFSISFAIAALALSACSPTPQQKSQTSMTSDADFYAKKAREVRVSFTAKYRTDLTKLEEVAALPQYTKDNIQNSSIVETLTYMFGPLTYREIGGPKKDGEVVVDWNSAALSKDGKVEVSYTYSGTWILKKEMDPTFEMPLPLNEQLPFSKSWKRCSDSEPDHQTTDFYWYFWDPTRYGCDQKLTTHYQNITVAIGTETVQTTASFPQYADLLKSNGKANNLQMTFGFGYVEDPAMPNPQTDNEYGATEYQRFLEMVREETNDLVMTETPILEKEYKGARRPDQQIGVRFTGKKGKVTVTINAVMAADIDPMELFAKSYAHDHDGFFAWFGHSRVGSNFDANNFRSMVRSNPSYYSIVPNYQMIYWAGCNSYSYYSIPFFKNKAEANPTLDPQGTKGLDIISNGLPSLFQFNADNARVTLNSLLNWERKDSFQTIVDNIEAVADRDSYLVLVNVLGDEDNVTAPAPRKPRRR